MLHRRALLRADCPRRPRMHLSFNALLPLIRVRNWSGLRHEVLGASFACNVESVEGGLVKVDFRGQDDVLVVGLEEDMGKGRAEVGPIKSISALGNVHFFALGAIDFDSILTKLIAQCVWHHSLLVTKGARAVPVCTLQVLAVN